MKKGRHLPNNGIPDVVPRSTVNTVKQGIQNIDMPVDKSADMPVRPHHYRSVQCVFNVGRLQS